MATTLRTDIVWALTAILNKAQGLDADGSAHKAKINAVQNWTSGTTAGKADLLLDKNNTLAASAVKTYDLDAGTETDGFGDGVTMVETRGVYIHNKSATAIISISGDNGIVGSGFTLRPGERFMKFVGDSDSTGYPITGASNDTIIVTNDDGSNSAEYDILIVGTSA